jgi:hypothetical protein
MSGDPIAGDMDGNAHGGPDKGVCVLTAGHEVKTVSESDPIWKDLWTDWIRY